MTFQFFSYFFAPQKTKQQELYTSRKFLPPNLLCIYTQLFPFLLPQPLSTAFLLTRVFAVVPLSDGSTKGAEQPSLPQLKTQHKGYMAEHRGASCWKLLLAHTSHSWGESCNLRNGCVLYCLSVGICKSNSVGVFPIFIWPQQLDLLIARTSPNPL